MFDGITDLNHNNTVDLAALKNAGIAAIIHKATEGATFQDPAYATRRQEASQLGLRWGAYHFGTAADVTQQLDNFLQTAQLADGDLAALDYETNAGNQMTLAQAEEFVTLFQQRMGFYPVLYGSSLLTNLSNDTALGSCPLWIAAYVNEAAPVLPPLFSSWALWQFTDGSAPSTLLTAGVALDRDRYGGTEEELLAAWPFRA